MEIKKLYFIAFLQPTKITIREHLTTLFVLIHQKQTRAPHIRVPCHQNQLKQLKLKSLLHYNKI